MGIYGYVWVYVGACVWACVHHLTPVEIRDCRSWCSPLPNTWTPTAELRSAGLEARGGTQVPLPAKPFHCPQSDYSNDQPPRSINSKNAPSQLTTSPSTPNGCPYFLVSSILGGKLNTPIKVSHPWLPCIGVTGLTADPSCWLT